MFEIAIIISIIAVSFFLMVSAVETKKSDLRVVSVIAGLILITLSLGYVYKTIKDRDEQIQAQDYKIYKLESNIEELKNPKKETHTYFEVQDMGTDSVVWRLESK